jgi:hypothetical protein
MEHPIPRQITTFEFKLIGFLTIKQFIYLIVFIPTAYVVYMLFPIPLLNILLAFCVGGLGVALAFVPINDRPMDVWMKNLVKRLTSPTQYTYHKSNSSIYFLKDLFFSSNPHITLTHIESQQKLANYLNKTRAPSPVNPNKATVIEMLQNPSLLLKKEVPPPAAHPSQSELFPSPDYHKKPFFNGTIKNHKLIPLPGIMIYVKDSANNVIRILKTNPHGVFATFSPLPAGVYTIETKDPKSTYFFDTMKINLNESSSKPIEIYSKELL